VTFMTARVKVLLHAMFRDIAGKREITQEVDSNFTLGDVLIKLAKKYGRDFNEIIDPRTGQISTDTLVMLNGKSVRQTDIKLNDKDIVMITVPIVGG